MPVKMLVFERRAEKRKEKPGKSLLTDNTEFSDFILVALWFVYIKISGANIFSIKISFGLLSTALAENEKSLLDNSVDMKYSTDIYCELSVYLM